MLCPICQSPNPPELLHCRACGALLAAAGHSQVLPSGARLLGGAYSLERALGQGGFGITYLGRDHGLVRAVAVKEFFPAGCVRAGVTMQPGGSWTLETLFEAKARFLEEARV